MLGAEPTDRVFSGLLCGGGAMLGRLGIADPSAVSLRGFEAGSARGCAEVLAAAYCSTSKIRVRWAISGKRSGGVTCRIKRRCRRKEQRFRQQTVVEEAWERQNGIFSYADVWLIICLRTMLS